MAKFDYVSWFYKRITHKNLYVIFIALMSVFGYNVSIV